MSPDPYNAGADPTNRQSWNMYSYVVNDPLDFIDPSGMQLRGPLGTPGSSIDPGSMIPINSKYVTEGITSLVDFAMSLGNTANSSCKQ